MRSTRILLIVTYFLVYHTAYGDEAITFFFKPYPIIKDSKLSQKIVDKLRRPGKIAKYTLNGALQESILDGIFSSYAGFLTVSDLNGQSAFPRKHENPLIYFLITTKITPMMMSGITIHHWELETGTPAAMYSAEKKQDEETDAFYWDVQKIELPENNRIPLETVIVFAKPKNIYIPTGITLSHKSANIILPDIYVKKGINILKNALYVLNIKHFFGTIRHMYKPEETRYARHLT